MDLIRQMMLNREAKGIGNQKQVKQEAPMSKVESFQGGKSLSGRRKEIVQNKPKNKVVKEYFKDLIEMLADCSDSEDD